MFQVEGKIPRQPYQSGPHPDVSVLWSTCRLYSPSYIAATFRPTCNSSAHDAAVQDDTHVLHYLLPPRRAPADYGLLEHIQQFMQGLVILKTLSSYMV